MRRNRRGRVTYPMCLITPPGARPPSSLEEHPSPIRERPVDLPDKKNHSCLFLLSGSRCWPRRVWRPPDPATRLGAAPRRFLPPHKYLQASPSPSNFHPSLPLPIRLRPPVSLAQRSAPLCRPSSLLLTQTWTTPKADGRDGRAPLASDGFDASPARLLTVLLAAGEAYFELILRMTAPRSPDLRHPSPRGSSILDGPSHLRSDETAAYLPAYVYGIGGRLLSVCYRANEINASRSRWCKMTPPNAAVGLMSRARGVCDVRGDWTPRFERGSAGFRHRPLLTWR